MESRTQWRGERDTSRRRLLRLLALSVLLHAPLTPIAAIVGLIGLLGRPADPDPSPADPITAIPIDLIGAPGPAAAGPEPEPAPTSSEPKAGAPDPFDELEDEDLAGPAEPPDAGPAASPDAGAAPGDAGASDAGGAIPDPVALSGAAGRVADANANVRLLIFNDRIRHHPLGVRIGTLLGLAAQWQDFFGPTGLDPIRDVDRILIAGPQLRDSSEVVAVLQTNVPDERVKQAVDVLVKRQPGGGWLDAGVLAARASADRAERLFVMPAPHIVVVVPPSAQQHALSLGPSLKFPKPRGSEALSTYVVTPWRAFRGIPFKVPQSIKWVRMKITATSDGGAVADLVAEDESAEAAKQHAGELSDAINAVTQVNLSKAGFLGRFGALVTGKSEFRLIEPVKLSANGREIRGAVVATPAQLKALLEAISNYAEQLAQEAAKKQAADAGSDGGSALGTLADAGVTPDASVAAAPGDAAAPAPAQPPSQPTGADAAEP